MSVAKTIRISEELNLQTDEFAQKNGPKFNQVVGLALEKYINGQNTIELEPVDKDKWKELTTKNFSKHKEAMSVLHSAFYPGTYPFTVGGIAKTAGTLCFYGE